MSNKLLPCPFCGEDAERQDWLERYGRRFAVWCSDIYCISRSHDESPEIAAERWNRRTSTTPPPEPEQDGGVQAAIASAISRHSAENGSNTPDFLLAAFLVRCLEAFDASVRGRDGWYGVKLRPGAGHPATTRLRDIAQRARELHDWSARVATSAITVDKGWYDRVRDFLRELAEGK